MSFLPSSGCFRFTGLTAISLPESLPFPGENSVGHRLSMLGHSKVTIEIGVCESQIICALGLLPG